MTQRVEAVLKVRNTTALLKYLSFRAEQSRNLLSCAVSVGSEFMVSKVRVARFLI